MADSDDEPLPPGAEPPPQGEVPATSSAAAADPAAAAYPGYDAAAYAAWAAQNASAYPQYGYSQYGYAGYSAPSYGYGYDQNAGMSPRPLCDVPATPGHERSLRCLIASRCGPPRAPTPGTSEAHSQADMDDNRQSFGNPVLPQASLGEQLQPDNGKVVFTASAETVQRISISTRATRRITAQQRRRRLPSQELRPLRALQALHHSRRHQLAQPPLLCQSRRRRPSKRCPSLCLRPLLP